MTTDNRPQGWENDFDREFHVRFDNIGRPTLTSYSGWTDKDIKKFIRTLLSKERQLVAERMCEVVEKVKSDATSDYTTEDTLHEYREAVLSALRAESKVIQE